MMPTIPLFEIPVQGEQAAVAEMAAALKAAKVAMQERCQARKWQCEGKFCGPACAGQCEAQCVPGFTEVLAKWNGGANS